MLNLLIHLIRRVITLVKYICDAKTNIVIKAPYILITLAPLQRTLYGEGKLWF